MLQAGFDTLSASKSLRDAGFDERSAEAIVTVDQRTADGPDLSHLATKDDLGHLATRDMVARLEARIDGIDKRLDDLRSLSFANFGLYLAGLLGLGAFLYAVPKH